MVWFGFVSLIFGFKCLWFYKFFMSFAFEILRRYYVLLISSIIYILQNKTINIDVIQHILNAEL